MCIIPAACCMRARTIIGEIKHDENVVISASKSLPNSELRAIDLNMCVSLAGERASRHEACVA